MLNGDVEMLATITVRTRAKSCGSRLRSYHQELYEIGKRGATLCSSHGCFGIQLKMRQFYTAVAGSESFLRFTFLCATFCVCIPSKLYVFPF